MGEGDPMWRLRQAHRWNTTFHINITANILLNLVRTKTVCFNMYLWIDSNIFVFESFERFELP